MGKRGLTRKPRLLLLYLVEDHVEVEVALYIPQILVLIHISHKL